MMTLMTTVRRCSLIAAAAAMLALSSASFAGAGCNKPCDKGDKNDQRQVCSSCEKCKDGGKECCKDAQACKTCCGEKKA